jgi:hypothetical protein
VWSNVYIAVYLCGYIIVDMIRALYYAVLVIRGDSWRLTSGGIFRDILRDAVSYISYAVIDYSVWLWYHPGAILGDILRDAIPDIIPPTQPKNPAFLGSPG